MGDASVLRRGLNPRTLFLGAFAGCNIALPLYLWQQNAEVALAAFIVVGYTAWMWIAAYEEISALRDLRQDMRELPINRFRFRLWRMATDLGFWWSLTFGAAMVGGSVWYVGVQDPWMLGGILSGWSAVAIALNFGVTLLHPSTRCRRCRYDLVAHIDPNDRGQRVNCPECGARWSKADMGIVAPGESRRSRRRRRPLSKKPTLREVHL